MSTSVDPTTPSAPSPAAKHLGRVDARANTRADEERLGRRDLALMTLSIRPSKSSSRSAWILSVRR